MRGVAILTITGVLALVVALLTGSTPLAILAIGFAIAGIVLLVRDWRDDRNRPAEVPEQIPGGSRAAHHELTPDDFFPDISTDPDGPSSDARAD